MGCTQGQGYLFAHALPAVEAAGLLDAREPAPLAA
jgi:EAL domain-containing protein (putative c-di-GMP-specific phosphodiesterase class I)